MASQQYLMSEQDILQYFLQNNGLVRNTDIVTYFRYYLSDPNIREEARVLFKSYVNKLANVKTENGEKFLVLKRQYYPPIDGSPNRPSSTNPIPSYTQPHCNNNNPYGYPPSRPSGPSPYDSSYPPPPQQHHSLQRSLSQQSQSQSLYGSAFSLNSNYMDPYPTYSHPPPPLNSNQYVGPTMSPPHMNYGIPPSSSSMEYGLPPPPQLISPPNKRFPPPPSNNSLNTSISSGRLPPPYRPPPPAARFSMTGVGSQPTTPPYAVQANAGPIVRHPANLHSGRFPSPQNQLNYTSEPTTPTGPQIQFQRSLSVSGSLTSPPPTQLQYEAVNYFERNSSVSSLSGSAPPVPPRSKRAFERSLTRSGSLVSACTTMDEFESGRKDDSEGGFMTERNIMGNGTALSNRVRGYSEGREGNVYDSPEKENVLIGNGVPHGIDGGGAHDDNGHENVSSNGGSDVNGNNFEGEQKISVKERLQKFNLIASESELTAGTVKMPSATRNRSRDIASKHDSVDYDTASLSSFGFGFASMQPRDKEWILKASQCDYHYLNKMAHENPSLVKRKDINYTALHWASKHGNTDLVKLLAGTFKSNVNAKSNGGYTPLHLAAQFGRTEVYDVLAQVYNADVNARDHSGKKAMQYLVRQDTSVSMDTFKKLKEKRRSAEHNAWDRNAKKDSFLRIGSLNVRVKKTALNNFLGGKSNSATSIERILHKSWGSADNIIPPECDNDKHIMPPPSSIPRSSSKAKRKTRTRSNQPSNSAIKETRSADSDSDSAAGFGDWPR